MPMACFLREKFSKADFCCYSAHGHEKPSSKLLISHIPMESKTSQVTATHDVLE
jgi:hypothetical protein